jgi:hypothetical protein
MLVIARVPSAHVHSEALQDDSVWSIAYHKPFGAPVI